MTSPSRTKREPANRPCRRGHFGQPVGDVVQRAGVEADLVAVAVHLDADAVEFLLHRADAEPADRLGDGGRGMGEHRQHRAADGEPERLQRPRPLAEQRLRHRLQRPGQHHRPPHVGRAPAIRPA